jgi:predicted Zn-dependent peptidase
MPNTAPARKRCSDPYYSYDMMLATVLLTATLTAATTGSAGYTPEDLLAYEHVGLANGFTMILNPRPQSRSVSVRLAVDVGTHHFDCGVRELPHLAEHLLFSGTSTHTETELDAAIASLGGSWNAFVSDQQTVYTIEIFHDHLLEALSLLHSMFTDTTLTDQTVETAKRIVQEENGGEPGWVRRFLYRNGIYDGFASKAYRQYVPETRAFCNEPLTSAHLARSDVEAFLAAYYVPARMSLIAVGRFDPAAVRSAIAESFGTLPSRTVELPPTTAATAPRTVRFRTRTAEPLGSSVYASVEFPIPVAFDADRVALMLVRRYLESALFEDLRLDRAIAYSPGAAINDFSDFATLELFTSVTGTNAGEAEEALAAHVERLRRDGIAADEVHQLRQGMLYELASAFESNGAIASYYQRHSLALRAEGRLPDYGSLLYSVDTGRVSAVIETYLDPSRALHYRAGPTVTYGQLGGALGTALLLPAGLILRRRWRRTA